MVEGLLVLDLECLWLVWRIVSVDAPPSSLQQLAAAISVVVVAVQESGLADSEVVLEVVTEVVMAAAARYVSRHGSQEIGSCLMRWSKWICSSMKFGTPALCKRVAA